jgi:hypothetical protein
VIGDARAGRTVDAVRDGGTRLPRRRTTAFTARSATARPVVYFTPMTVIAPSAPSRAWSRINGTVMKSGAPRFPATAGSRPRWTSVTSDGVKARAGKAALTSVTNAATSAAVTVVSSVSARRAA